MSADRQIPGAVTGMPADDLESGRGVAWHVLGLACLLLACAFSTGLRVHVTRADPYFDATTPAGLLRSDQGLIYYITERVAQAGGGIPPDFRADARIAHPDVADIPAMFSVAQEFLIAWTYVALDKEFPLHVVALWVMSLLASLVLIGAYGLVYEWTRRPGWAGLAALLLAVIPIHYRTMGLILLREDLSFPLFAAHLWLAARAVRRDSTGAWIGASLALAAALATWHAMSFVVALEVLAVLAWFARTGSNPFSLRAAWIVIATLVGACLAVPMLASKLFLLSPTMAVALGLFGFALYERRTGGRGLRRAAHARRVALCAVSVLAALVATQLAARSIQGGEGDYGHVIAFLRAKLTGLGAMPDPRELPFGARLLWQGPFMTSEPIEFVQGLGVGLVFLALGLALAVPTWWRARLERTAPGFAVFAGFLAISLVSAWLVRRTMILPGFGAAVLAVWPFLRPGRARFGALLLSAAVVGQGAFLLQRVSTTRIPWYRPEYQPVDYPLEIRHLVEWIDGNIDPSEALLGDFIVSTSILAHSGNPIVTQPKYETTESRERIEQYFTTFFHGDLDGLKQLMRRYQARYLFVDRFQMAASQYLGGLAPGSRGPTPGTPAAFLLRRDAAALRAIPGLRLIYETPAGLGRGTFVLFELVDES